MIPKRVKGAALALVALGLTWSAHGLASHNSWVLKDSGIACSFLSYDGDVNNGINRGIGVSHSISGLKTVICPVTLAGIWPSNGSVTYARNMTARALFSAVQVFDNNSSQNVNCQAQATTSTGSIYYSQSAYTSGTGWQKIWLKTHQSGATWGYSLGTGNYYLNALNYYCNLPPATQLHQINTGICAGPNGCVNIEAPSVP